MSRSSLPALTRAGLPGIGGVPWGSHFCQFYRDRAELLASTALYFKAGLDGGERCLWLTHDVSPAEARRELERQDPSVREMVQEGRIRFQSHREFLAGKPDVVALLDREENRALGDGYKGLRVAGNPTFVKARAWPSLMRIESEIDSSLPRRRVLVLCSYSVPETRPTEIFEIIRGHRFALERQDEHWMLHRP